MRRGEGLRARTRIDTEAHGSVRLAVELVDLCFTEACRDLALIGAEDQRLSPAITRIDDHGVDRLLRQEQRRFLGCSRLLGHCRLLGLRKLSGESGLLGLPRLFGKRHRRNQRHGERHEHGKQKRPGQIVSGCLKHGASSQ